MSKDYRNYNMKQPQKQEKVLKENEITVSVLGKEVIVYKASNRIKIDNKEFFIGEIVWETVSDKVLREIEKVVKN